MNEILRSKTVNSKWLGKSGSITTHHLDRSPMGLRITVFKLEGEPFVVSLIKGDGRRVHTFERIEQMRFDSEFDVEAAVASLVNPTNGIS